MIRHTFVWNSHQLIQALDRQRQPRQAIDVWKFLSKNAQTSLIKLVDFKCHASVSSAKASETRLLNHSEPFLVADDYFHHAETIKNVTKSGLLRVTRQLSEQKINSYFLIIECFVIDKETIAFCHCLVQNKLIPKTFHAVVNRSLNKHCFRDSQVCMISDFPNKINVMIELVQLFWVISDTNPNFSCYRKLTGAVLFNAVKQSFLTLENEFDPSAIKIYHQLSAPQ